MLCIQFPPFRGQIGSMGPTGPTFDQWSSFHTLIPHILASFPICAHLCAVGLISITSMIRVGRPLNQGLGQFDRADFVHDPCSIYLIPMIRMHPSGPHQLDHICSYVNNMESARRWKSSHFRDPNNSYDGPYHGSEILPKYPSSES